MHTPRYRLSSPTVTASLPPFQALLARLLLLALATTPALGGCGDDSGGGGDGDGDSALDQTPGPGQPGGSLDGGPPDDLTVQVPNAPRDAPMTLPTGRGPLSIAAQHPLTSSHLLVRVLNTLGNPLDGAQVSAGGALVDTRGSGLVFVDAVHGSGGMTDVYAFYRQSITHVRVPIRDGETTLALLVIGGHEGQLPIEDAAAALTVPAPEEPPEEPADDDAGVELPVEVPPSGPPAPRLEAAAGVLQQPWGAPAAGRAAMGYTQYLDAPDAAGLPAGMLAVGDAGPVPLAALGAIDLRFVQGRTALELVGEATLHMQLADGHPSTSALLATPRLYVFEPTEGLFVERGSVTVVGNEATLSIDREGFWVIGVPMDAPTCVSGTATDSAGAPLPQSALRVIAELDGAAFMSAHVHADSNGGYCAQLAGEGTAALHVLGMDETGRAPIDVVAAPPSPGPACGGATSCLEADVQTDAAHPICVTGVVDAPSGVNLFVQAQPDTQMTIAATTTRLSRGGAFCVEMPPGSELRTSAPLLDCGDAIPVPSSGGSACGGDSCQDLGTITCCAGGEVCDGSRDDDCDGVFEEGCECGGSACVEPALDGCCAGDLCGARSEHTGLCVGRYAQTITSVECPGEEIPSPFEAGSTLPRLGCCLEGVCGLLESEYGCLPRERMHELYPLPAALAPIACTGL